jgi:hypothetical protein
MRAVFLAFVTAAVMSSTGPSPASANDYPYCIQGDDYAGGPGECIFTTRAQCMATASGRTAYCTENRYLGANAQLIDRNRLRHRSR